MHLGVKVLFNDKDFRVIDFDFNENKIEINDKIKIINYYINPKNWFNVEPAFNRPLFEIVSGEKTRINILTKGFWRKKHYVSDTLTRKYSITSHYPKWNGYEIRLYTKTPKGLIEWEYRVKSSEEKKKLEELLQLI